MKKGIIIYQSKYGATKKYVEWLRKMTGFECVETPKALISEVMNYEIVLLCGGIYASGIAGLSFLKKNINKLRNEGYVKSWFYRILINEAIKASKNNRYFVEYNFVENEIHSNSYENEVVEKLDIYKAVQKLNEKLKTVIILRFFEDLKIEEIAYITKTNLNTVKSRLYKGMEEIRKSIERRNI